MTIFVTNIEFTLVHCASCNTPFCMTTALNARRREDHKDFMCPSGHSNVYNGPTKADKLQTELTRKEQMLQAEQARANRLAQERNDVQKAHKRMRTRVMNGVCPCCNRTFQNLMMHMKTEHASEVTLRNIRLAYGMTQSTIAHEIGVTMAHVSAVERDKPVPEYAQKTIERWLIKQESKV